jgi:outer membrane protein OmpA-like peptidoglycan-associated protein
MRSAALLLLAFSLAACDWDIGNQVAGSSLDEGGFGNPSLNNQLVMSGEESYVASLNKRFAQSVPTVVHFAFNSAALSPQARAILDRQANFIRQFPELFFSVYGYTDLVGSAGYNDRLGRARAEAVVGYLGQRGVSRQRLRALVSYGETRPVVPVAGPEMANRRAITQVSGFVRSHPTVMDGKYGAVIYREYVESATSRQAAGLSVESINNPQ